MIKIEKKFSVIIPTYNRPDYIIRAVNSVLSLNRSDTEIIVINDGSKSSYDEFLSLHGDKIKYIHNSKSFGVAKSRNIGSLHSTGEWLLFLDDDDELSCGYLGKLAAKIPTSKNLSSFWTGAKIISKKQTYERVFPGHYDDIRYLIKDFLSVGTGFGFTIKKQIFNQQGKFDESFHVGEDTEFFFNLISAGHLPTPIPGIGVIKHEEHNDRLNSTFREYSWNNVYGRIFEKYRNSFCKHWRFNYAHFLMWSYKVHRDNGNSQYAKTDMNELISLGIPAEHIEFCYNKKMDISDTYLLTPAISHQKQIQYPSF